MADFARLNSIERKSGIILIGTFLVKFPGYMQWSDETKNLQKQVQ